MLLSLAGQTLLAYDEQTAMIAVISTILATMDFLIFKNINSQQLLIQQLIACCHAPSVLVKAAAYHTRHDFIVIWGLSLWTRIVAHKIDDDHACIPLVAAIYTKQ